ncbi:MAG: hypothetical protein Q8N47_23565 [Bryobacterales bacterium]|nr:hypothetical protein [Bryobacterales bacterium]
MTLRGWRCGCFCFLLAAAAGAADWTDRGEYDLALAIRAEPAPKARLQLLDQWKARYPKTEMRQVRRELYLYSFQSLGDSDGMLAVAAEMVSEEPGNPVGQYWCAVLIPGGKNGTEETLRVGERAARTLISGLDANFAPARKPASLPEAEWQKQRAKTELLAHRALGWIRWQRGDYPGAQEELTACLRKEPGNAEMSAWLGTVLALEKQPDKQVPALWHLARAATLRGDGALPDRQQRQIGALLDRLYTSYHGDASGLDQLRTAAGAGAFPPPDFKIETAAAVAARRQEEELERNDPMLAAWLRIRKRLEAPDGAQYFETLRASPLPRLRGTVIRSSPPRRPNEIVLAMQGTAAEEVVLKLASPFSSQAVSGILIEFEGMAESFTPSPFALTVAAEREKVEGWPAGVSGPRPRQ